MGHDRLSAGLLCLLALTACGGHDAGTDQQTEVVALRARHDSVVKARADAAAKDSIARVEYAACSDSVTTALKGSKSGRAQLAANRPAGMILPAVLTACGSPLPEPQQTRVGGTAAPAAAMAPAAGDTAKPAALTPTQRRVSRADSVRQAREAADVEVAAAAHADSVHRAAADSILADSLHRASETDVVRESFVYGGGTRDPFNSLLNTAHIGPELVDLQLVGVYQDLRNPENSVAVVKEKASGKRYKLRNGDQIGRMQVARIEPRDVVFTIEDLGYERQESLSLRKQEDVTP